MNLDEAKKVMNVLYTNYPQYYKDFKPENFDMQARIWAMAFENISVNLVKKALAMVLAEDKSGFPPAPGKVREKLSSKITVYNAEKEWAEIEYIVRNVPEGYWRRLQQCDDITKKIVTEYDIRTWKDVPGAMVKAMPDFIRRYNRLKEDAETQAIESGNLLAISNEERLTALGVTITGRIGHVQSE